MVQATQEGPGVFSYAFAASRSILSTANAYVASGKEAKDKSSLFVGQLGRAVGLIVGLAEMSVVIPEILIGGVARLSRGRETPTS